MLSSGNKTANIYVKNYSFKHTYNDGNITRHRKQQNQLIVLKKVKGRHLYTATYMNMTSSGLQCEVAY